MNKSIALSLLAAALLAACSEDKPSNALFEKTINEYAEKNGVCLPLVLNVQTPRTPDSFVQVPIGVGEIKLADKTYKGGDINHTALKQLDLLEQEGFYDKSTETAPAETEGKEPLKVLVYKLTDNGRKHTQSKGKMPHFCVGHQKVKKINWFTEPSPSNGMTMSRVSYEAEFVPEKWLAPLLKAGGGSKLAIEEVRAQTATIVKTSEGWKDSRELN